MAAAVELVPPLAIATIPETLSAFPVILPAMGLVTVKLARVPTLVKLEPVTVDLIVVPVNCSADAAAAIEISVVPSKATPLMVFEAANLVAVPALPEIVV